MNGCTSAVIVRIARLQETARMPARERRIERSTSPCECSCSSCSCSTSRSTGWSGSWCPSCSQSTVPSGARRWLTRPSYPTPRRKHLFLVVVLDDAGRCRRLEGHPSLACGRRFRSPLAFDLDVPEEHVQAEVVDAFQRAGDQERGAEGAAEGGAGDERRDGSGQVASAVGVGGGGSALARVDDGDDISLPRRHVGLGEQEAGEQKQDRDRQVGGEGDGGEKQVRGEVCED